MRFCPDCDNMYYISITKEEDQESNADSDEDQLYYYCRNCKNKEVMKEEDACVYTTQIKSTKQQFHHIINQYTKHDPTLPRINTIPCPNKGKEGEGCRAEKPEVIYIRYDDEKQLYIYLCTACDTVWRTDRFGDLNDI